MRRWIVPLWLTLWAASALAGPSRLAVLELHDEAELGAAATGYLTDTVRGAAAETLGEGWFILTRENLVTALPPGTDLAACAGDCEVDMGRTLGADQVLSGSVVRLEGALTVSLQLHATADGRLVGRETASGANAKALEGPVSEATAALLARLAPDADPARVQISGPRGLEVFIDGVQVGTTPLDARKLTPGKHTLVVSARCKAELKLPLTVKAGERRVVDVNPPPRTVAVTVDARDSQGEPVKGVIEADGEPVGDSSAPVQVPVCAQRLAVTTEAGGRWATELHLEPDEPVTLTATVGGQRRAAQVTQATTTPPKRRKRKRGGAAAGWLFTGGLTATLVGVAFAGKNQADGEALQKDPTNQTLRDDVDASYQASLGFYIGGGAAMALGLALWALDSGDDEGEQALQVGVGPGGALVRGRF